MVRVIDYAYHSINNESGSRYRLGAGGTGLMGGN